MAIYELNDLVSFARKNSPYYRELYQHLPDGTLGLKNLPVLEQESFWTAAHAGALLTGAQADGVVFKSGGTTGAPKFSVFTCEEWDEFTRVFGRGMAEGGGIRNGDRVANIFYAGQLYASFLFIMRSIDFAPVAVTQFPLGGATPIDEVVKALKEFSINILAGVPTSIMQILAYLADQGIKLPKLERILYGGEAMYTDQIATVKAVLPHVECQSVGWASVDGGILGYFGKGCDLGEHRVFDDATIIELIDEDTGDVITDVGVQGKVILTNLTRKLMPIIRYPAGDLAVWSEPQGTKNRKLKIVGRSNEGARVGPATVYLDDIRRVLAKFSHEIPYLGFQIIVTHAEQKDAMTIVVGLSQERSEKNWEAKLIAALFEERKMLSDLLEKGLIHPVSFAFRAFASLERNERTGKLKSVIDKRFA